MLHAIIEINTLARKYVTLSKVNRIQKQSDQRNTSVGSSRTEFCTILSALKIDHLNKYVCILCNTYILEIVQYEQEERKMSSVHA